MASVRQTKSGSHDDTIEEKLHELNVLGFSRGGVDDVTRTVAVHGTKNRPELILNNSQSCYNSLNGRF